MQIKDNVKINSTRFNPDCYPNPKKFAKVTQALMKPHQPFPEYEIVNKNGITNRDIYTADVGDIIVCLMNTKVKLIGIVDRFCIIPNTFCVLRPNSFSTHTLYALFKMQFIQNQLITTKKSITIKDVKEIMLPYEISSAHDVVLNYLSKQFQQALISRTSFQNIIDTEFDELKYSLPLELEAIMEFHEINKVQSEDNLGKKDLPSEEILVPNREVKEDCATILIPRKLKDIDELRAGIICADPKTIKVNQNLIKLTVTTEILDEIGFDKYNLSHLTIAKYVCYYFLSSQGKAQLKSYFESNENQSFKSLRMNRLKHFHIPLALNLNSIVENIEAQIYWHDAERFSAQLDHSSSMFKEFDAIITLLATNDSFTHYAPKNLFNAREFSILLAMYTANLPNYQNLNISVVLESLVHYDLFENHFAESYEDLPIEFYGPHHEVRGDIIIVIEKFKQPLKLPVNAKIIYIKGQ